MCGKIFFISGPSGVGKGTLIDLLRQKYSNFIFPPSCTTREPRAKEQDGKTYYYLTKEEFQKKIDNKELLEWAKVHDKDFYGTLKKPLVDGVKQGKIIIREFDVQGFLQARKKLPRNYFVSIFLSPSETPNRLVERIEARSPISKEETMRRLESMKKEMNLAQEYDHIIISKEQDFTKLLIDMEKIIMKYTIIK